MNYLFRFCLLIVTHECKYFVAFKTVFTSKDFALPIMAGPFSLSLLSQNYLLTLIFTTFVYFDIPFTDPFSLYLFYLCLLFNVLLSTFFIR